MDFNELFMEGCNVMLSEGSGTMSLGDFLLFVLFWGAQFIIVLIIIAFVQSLRRRRRKKKADRIPWTCPSCGTMMEKGGACCTGCNAPRPENAETPPAPGTEQPPAAGTEQPPAPSDKRGEYEDYEEYDYD